MSQTQEISKNLMCICVRGGIELWFEKDRVDGVVKLLSSDNPPPFIKIDEHLINIKDISGVFGASAMEERNHRKNGDWKCQKGNYWHQKFEQCGH